MKRILIFLLSSFTVLNAEPKTTFVITRSEQMQSVNELKEHVGESLKKAISEVAELNEKLAALQLEASTIQKKLLAQGERLLENKGVYCKATKKELAEASHALTAFEESINSLRNKVSVPEGSVLTKKYEQVALFAREDAQKVSA